MKNLWHAVVFLMLLNTAASTYKRFSGHVDNPFKAGWSTMSSDPAKPYFKDIKPGEVLVVFQHKTFLGATLTVQSRTGSKTTLTLQKSFRYEQGLLGYITGRVIEPWVIMKLPKGSDEGFHVTINLADKGFSYPNKRFVFKGHSKPQIIDLMTSTEPWVSLSALQHVSDFEEIGISPRGLDYWKD